MMSTSIGRSYGSSYYTDEHKLTPVSTHTVNSAYTYQEICPTVLQLDVISDTYMHEERCVFIDENNLLRTTFGENDKIKRFIGSTTEPSGSNKNKIPIEKCQFDEFVEQIQPRYSGKSVHVDMRRALHIQLHKTDLRPRKHSDTLLSRDDIHKHIYVHLTDHTYKICDNIHSNYTLKKKTTDWEWIKGQLTDIVCPPTDLLSTRVDPDVTEYDELMTADSSLYLYIGRIIDITLNLTGDKYRVAINRQK